MTLFAFLLILFALLGLLIAVTNQPEANLAEEVDTRSQLDLLITLGMAILGVIGAFWIHHYLNPYGYPVGQDWREFIVLARDIQTDGALKPVPQRYPFYPWLAVQWSALTGLPLYRSLMEISIASFGLMPAALYLLGIQLVPRPIAISGAVLSLTIPTLGALLGPPSDYLMQTTIHVLCLASGMAALRRGGWLRWFGFGLSLALIMAATMKCLVYLLGAVPLVGLALVRTGMSNRRNALISAAAWLLPMTIIWCVYAGQTRHVQDAYSLEYNIYRTQVVVAQAHGRVTSMPPDWHPTDEKRRGYWGVGRKGAFKHLPDTLAFLARGPDQNLPANVRLDGALRGLSTALHVPWPGLFLMLLGCVSLLRPRTDPFPALLATAWICGISAAHFFGLMSTHYIDRYALTLLAPGPLLMFAGLHWLIRALTRFKPMPPPRSWWWLYIATAAFMGFPDKMPGLAGIKSAPEAHSLALNPHPEFWAIRDGLKKGDLVVDLTGNGIVADLFAGTAATVQEGNPDDLHIRLPPHFSGRRILIEPGTLNMGDAQLRWYVDSADPIGERRLQTLRPHVREDSAPLKSLSLHLSGLGR